MGEIRQKKQMDERNMNKKKQTWSQYLQILLPVLLCGVVSMLLAWIIDRMVVDVIMGYRHFKKSMIE